MAKKKILLGLAISGVVALVMNGQGPASFPAIVVLNDDARFEDFAPGYQADDRAAADPLAWGYLNRGVAGAVQSLERRHGFRSDNVYSHAIRGFSARLTTRQISQLESDPLVKFVESDGTMTTVAQILPWGVDKIQADVSSTLAGNGSGSVTGVTAYVIDTGIDNHADLNLVGHVNFGGGPNKDCNGHGTHVAGTIGAKDDTQSVVGVAPGVRLVAVKVLNCAGSGSTSGVTKGIDWVTANRILPAVANMSLGGGVSAALDQAVRNSAAAGVFYAIAAGNSGAAACNSSPARAGAGTNNGIMTVAATDSNDNEASWSNYGPCVDIWFPGVNILSTRNGGGTTTMSGTSMASPHGAGAGALYLFKFGATTPTNVEAGIKAAAVLTGNTSKDGVFIRRGNVSSF